MDIRQITDRFFAAPQIDAADFAALPTPALALSSTTAQTAKLAQINTATQCALPLKPRG